MESTPASGMGGYGGGGAATPGSAMHDEGPGTASSSASASLQLLAVRHQARLELRAALHQLTQRGLVYASKWCAELLCDIDLHASSASTSTLTSAMQSRLASHQKATPRGSSPRSQTHSRNGSVARGPAMPPPSFDQHMGGAMHPSQHAPSRRQTISTKLAFATPGPADSTPGPTRAAASAHAFALPPLAAVSPILATPQPAMASDHGDRMRDTPASEQQGATPLPQPSLSSLRAAAALGPLHMPASLLDDGLTGETSDLLLLARSYMDLKEYRRAAFVLRDVPLHPRALFVRCYSLYLAGEKRKEEEVLEKSKTGAGADGGAAGPMGADGDGDGEGAGQRVVNRELRGLQSSLAAVLVRDASTLAADGSPLPGHPLAPFIGDGHLWFLYGLVLRELGLRSAARNALLVSVATFPWNWGAWTALAGFVHERGQLELVMSFLHQRAADQVALSESEHARLAAECASQGRPAPHPLPPHASGVFMKDMFYSESLISLQSNAESESLLVLDQLCAVFPDSMHVRTTSALAYYHRREFAEAQHLLELVSQLDPYRLEHMDTYSNILFVHGDRARLSELAARAHATDKYRVQTCCIVGNYYAMRGDHARAILYFKRALALEPSYLSAWTLMGHEHVELRATPQAIECYRRALDINPLDYRAWYGLGQTYEILQMHRYALYYFKRAAGIKPYDPRMWCAVGENYEKLAMDTAANAGSVGPGAAAGAGAGGSLQAARLLESALKCYQKAEGNHDADGLALHKLAKLHRRRGQTDLAAKYYMRVLRRHEGEGGALGAGVGTAEWAAQDGAGDPAAAAAAAAAALDSSVSARPAPPSSSSQLLPGGTAPPLHQDAIDAILFLAEYHKMHGRYPLAEAYATRLLDVGGPSRDAAKSLLIEIRQHSQAIQQRAALASMHAHATPKTNAAKPPAHAQQQQQAQPHQSPALADHSSASFFSHGGTPARGTATPAAGGGAQSALSSPSGGSFFSTPMRSP